MPVVVKYKKYKGDSQDEFPRVNSRKVVEKRWVTVGTGIQLTHPSAIFVFKIVAIFVEARRSCI
jgi:hypothetical protein